MTPYYSDESVTIYHGDCREILPQLQDVRVNSVITSPPYAEQRKQTYGGVAETQYPAWTVGWMSEVASVLSPRGSVLINIRPHLRKGELSDYVLKTRLALRGEGWAECEELIWVKPNGAGPFGSLSRPRRAWESILWFGRTGDVWVDPKANGTPSLGGVKQRYLGKGEGAHVHGERPVAQPAGVPTMSLDVALVHTGGPVTWEAEDHPAPYPVPLATWMIRLVTPPGGVVLDPFVGSGSTLKAAKNLGHRAIGIEVEERYCEIAAQRLAQGVLAV